MKIIIMEIESCSDCPYCRYDGYYDCSKDSGYDCSAKNKRIIDDWDWDNHNNPNRLKKDFDDGVDIPMPDWCPLQEKETTKNEKVQSRDK